MPPNRQTIPKQQRLDEMLDAAEELFLENGYGATTMINIANRVGVTNNAVYWYLRSKDDALALVQERAFRRAIELADETATTGEDPLDRFFRFLEAKPMRDTRTLHRYLHERAEHNEAVRRVLDDIHDYLRAGIEAAARFRTTRKSVLDMLVESCVAVLEGTSATVSEQHGGELVRFVIGLAGSPGASTRRTRAR